ncbi:MAG TPA: rhomboid family intramembrane serine protease [Micromonosporaceae bacterium]
MNDVAPVLYAVVLGGAVWAGFRLIAERGSIGNQRVPVATITALVVVGVPTLIQLTAVPSLLGHLERDRNLIGDGEMWRLATALVAQDGGPGGAVFNLVSLAFVGAVAERIWGSARWTLIALVSGVAGELWGLLVQPVGAGNSVVVFGLAASVAVTAVRGGNRATCVVAAVCLLVAGALLLTADIHGGAAAAGAGCGLALDRQRSAERHATDEVRRSS